MHETWHRCLKLYFLCLYIHTQAKDNSYTRPELHLVELRPLNKGWDTFYFLGIFSYFVSIMQLLILGPMKNFSPNFQRSIISQLSIAARLPTKYGHIYELWPLIGGHIEFLGNLFFWLKIISLQWTWRKHWERIILQVIF